MAWFYYSFSVVQDFHFSPTLMFIMDGSFSNSTQTLIREGESFMFYDTDETPEAEEVSDMDSNSYFLYEVQLASHNQENTNTDASKGAEFSSELTKPPRQSTLSQSTLSLFVDHFSEKVDSAQERAEAFTRRRGDVISRRLTFSSPNRRTRCTCEFAKRVDLAQVQIEMLSRMCADSITKNVDLAQERAELLSRLVAKRVFGTSATRI